jgi:hypothetical protein
MASTVIAHSLSAIWHFSGSIRSISGAFGQSDFEVCQRP